MQHQPVDEKRMKVLVADDDRAIRFFLKMKIESEGHEVIEADNGLAALEVLKSQGGPDMAVLDWDMPELPGIEVCRSIRKTRTHGDLYLLMITAETAEDGVVCALEAGADDYLKKPMSLKEFLARFRAGVRTISRHQNIMS